MVKEQSWEIWEYPELGRYLDFLQKDDCYHLAAAIYTDRLHPVAVFQTRGSPGRQPPAAVPASGNFSLDARWARFKSDRPGQVRWEIYWRLPLEKSLGHSFRGLFSITEKNGAAATDSLFFLVENAGDSLRDEFAYGERNFDLKPGHYRLSFDLQDAGSGETWHQALEAELVEYVPAVQEASDAELVLLQDTTFTAEEFKKDGFLRVIPLADDVIKRRQPFFIYYEVYNLPTGADKKHLIKVSDQIFVSDRSGAQKECIVNTEPVVFEDYGNDFKGCHRVHPMDLPAGFYTILIQIEDLISGRISTCAKNFQIGDGAESRGAMPRRQDKEKTAMPEYAPGQPPLRQ